MNRDLGKFGEVVLGAGGEFGVDFVGVDRAGFADQFCEDRGVVAAAGADVDNVLPLFDRESG